MIQIVPHMRVLVARAPIDLRKGIDGTAAICRQTLDEDPLSGAVFVFRNRTGTMVRILVYDGQGMWLMTKRLSQGRFRFWCEPRGDPGISVAAHQMVALLAGGDWTSAGAAANWRPVGPASSTRIPP